MTSLQLEYVHQINEGSERLTHLVDDLLDFARLESGTFKLYKRGFDLGLTVREVVESLRPQTRRKRINVAIHLPVVPIPIVGDATRVGQVLSNLVGNALKFTPEGGRVTIIVKPAGAFLRVEVSDTGIGIPAEAQSHLFERFYQVDPCDTRPVGGTGLGLSIAKAIVEAHGGDIGVSSEPGRGSTFWFRVPLAG